MSELRALLENYWICREEDKELYNKVKRDIPKFQRFVREQLGWKLLNNEHLLKLEKIPAHAESFMGISEFQEIRDYAILCVVLMFLEDKEEQEQFLLSELIDFVGAELKSWMEVDWNSFTQRKSLVRVLKFTEDMRMLRVYEGNSELFSQGTDQEVLYENTGFSRYFATNFSFDLKECENWQDFEKVRLDELETDRGHFRVNRVYRQLTLCPAMYWDTNEDADSLYLKNQRQWVARYMKEQLGGRLDLHKNAAFWVLEEELYGKVHPRDAMISEAVLLVCTEIQERVLQGTLIPDATEKIPVTEEELDSLILDCRDRWREAWSKEYREMENRKVTASVKAYMRDWMMLEKREGQLFLCPAVGKQCGFYPADYHTTGDNEDE